MDAAGHWRSRFFERYGTGKYRFKAAADPSLYHYVQACGRHERKAGYNNCHGGRDGIIGFSWYGAVDGEEPAI